LPQRGPAAAAGDVGDKEVAMADRAESPEVRRRILQAAEDLFGRRSYERTGVADVARAAGIATGSFYRHFPSKRELVVELLRELNRELRREMRAAIGEATRQQDRERRAFTAFFRFLARHPYLFRIQRQVEFIAPTVYREYFDELARRYARSAKDAMVRAEIDPRFDPDFLAYAVYIGVAHFVGLRWVEWTEGGEVPGDIAEQVFLLLNKALRPVDPAASTPAGRRG
jgi:AcrR family transcriptional regulator